MSLEEFASSNEELTEVKRALNRAMRDLAYEKNRKADLVEAVYRAARDASMALTIPPVKPPKWDDRKRTPEVAIVAMADWQLAKVTKSYNSDVCEERIHRYIDRVIKLTETQRADHPVRECRLYLLGDLIEGELIFPGQAYLIDASLFRQVMVDGPRILGDAVRRLAGTFDRVFVRGVRGNHGFLGGRANREMSGESNGDTMMYEVTRLLVQAEKRVDWPLNLGAQHESLWYIVDKVGDKSFLLFHGDQIKGGFAGWPWYGFAKKISGWRMGAIPEPFDYSLSGHFHTPVRFQVGTIMHWGVGSPESDNTYAAEKMAAMGRPSQLLLFAHPQRGVTAEYNVWLDA